MYKILIFFKFTSPNPLDFSQTQEASQYSDTHQIVANSSKYVPQCQHQLLYPDPVYRFEVDNWHNVQHHKIQEGNASSHNANHVLRNGDTKSINYFTPHNLLRSANFIQKVHLVLERETLAAPR